MKVNSKEIASICGWHTPINLTSEWLLNFGFEESGFNMGEYEVDTYKLNGFTFSHASFGEKTARYQGKLLEYPTFVHQLQNLYFDLTGSELKLKEKV